MEAYEGKEKYVFVSYSHKDKEKMLWFVEELQKHCYVWYDSGIHAGNEWADKVADKLANCSLFLFLVSKNSLASDNCKDELAMARDSGKAFINIRLENVSFEGGMQLRYGRYQYFDLFLYDDAAVAVKELFKSESVEGIFSKQDVLKKWVNQTQAAMSQTEESSPTLNENNADYLVKFRTENTEVAFGCYCGAPIKWEIKKVRKDCAVLVSKEILETYCFDEDSVEYKESAVRYWLNGEFLACAFDEEEEKLLCPVWDGDAAEDKVSLLSNEQASILFKSDQERIKYGTDYAKGKGLLTNASGQGWWWLSSTDARARNCVHRVYSNGRIGFDADVDNGNIGIVPMIVVRID
jgi:hypothetical protein